VSFFNPDMFSENLWVSGYPVEPADFLRLKRDLGVDAVLSLQTDEDLRELGLKPDLPWRAAVGAGLEYVRCPMRDFDEEAARKGLAQALVELHRLVADGLTVLVHCTAGMNRSPTLALAYIMLVDGLTAQEAVERGKRARPFIRPYERVLLWVEKERRKLGASLREGTDQA
jgi:hypothetical protein